jgi:DNA repair protein RecO (recombination protein O)
MLEKTKGIVLHSLKYSETSIIVKIYTESFGIVSYLVRPSKNKKNGMKAGIFQPLAILDMIVMHKKQQGLQTIKEITQCNQFSQIPYDIKKSSIAVFIAEVLYKAIREEEQNESLFHFLKSKIELLDITDGRTGEFHISFLVELTLHLGFFPQLNYCENNIFNLYDGCFQENIPEHPYYISKELSGYFFNLVSASYDDRPVQGIPGTARKDLLDKILDYYRIHLNGFQSLKSHLVLEEVFN